MLFNSFRRFEKFRTHLARYIHRVAGICIHCKVNSFYLSGRRKCNLKRQNRLSGPVQMKATDQYFPVILFIMLYKVRVSKAIVKRARKTCNLFLNIAAKRVEELC